MADHIENLDEQGERDRNSASGGYPIDFAQSFRAQVEQHDDEKKKDHDRTRIDQHLNDADEEGIERDEEGGEAEKGNHEIERARDRIAIGDDSHAEDEHE